MAKIKNISSIELRQKINKLHSEMGYISKQSVKKIIDELEQKARSESEFHQMLDTL